MSNISFKDQKFPKRYFSKVPGSHYTFQDGKQIFFQNGRFDFDPKDFPGEFFSNNEKHPSNGRAVAEVYYEDLEYLVNTNNPLVFEQGKLPDGMKLPEGLDPSKNALSEASLQQGEAALLSTGRVRESGDTNNGSLGGGDVNASTVDRDLQNMILKPATGPGAGNSRVEQIRKEAAERAGKQQAAQISVANKNGMSG